MARTTPHGSEMVWVDGGEFLVGAPDGLGLPDEHPQRRARIQSFWLDRTEVTCAQYAAFLNEVRVPEQWRRSYIFARGEERPGPDKACLELRENAWRAVPGTEHLPMYWVSSFGARAFCEFHGLRLPTEAEWEAAAQRFLETGPDGSLVGADLEQANLRRTEARASLVRVLPPVGAAIIDAFSAAPVDAATCDAANADDAATVHAADADGATTADSAAAPVHLAGNVSEFVVDKYAEDAWSRLDAQNPHPVTRGTHGVIKGGSFADPPAQARIRRRVFSHALQCRFEFTGFRCAADAR